MVAATIETPIIDNVWSKIDGEYVIYQDELDQWAPTHTDRRGMPICPACRKAMGMINDRFEGGVRRAKCAGCGARLAILHARPKKVTKNV